MADRLQRRRTKGYRLPDAAVVVTRPTKWGNPHQVAKGSNLGGYARAAEMYRDDLSAGRLRVTRQDIRAELRGRDLACWCPLEDGKGNRVPCHADVLLGIANA